MSSLPQLHGRTFLTDGGLETTLIFHDGIDLPEFASFVLLEDGFGRDALKQYYRRYLNIAVAARRGFVLESVTWRANRDWGAKLGYDADALRRVNRDAIAFLCELRGEFSDSGIPLVISGNIGPRGDGYVSGDEMSIAAARSYHSLQASTFGDAGADVVTAMTMTYPNEAAGIVLAARDAGLPAVIGFTTETDGRLPNGATLRDAIGAVDDATDGGPAYYMINCAHPEHFAAELAADADWVRRIRGVRANASRLSHAELDAADTLDDGDPEEFGRLCAELGERLPGLAVIGGCCGTDHRHVDAAERCHGEAARARRPGHENADAA